MPGIKKRRDYFVTTAGNNYYDDNDLPKSYCPSCESFGFYNLLKERIYSKEERINGKNPADADNWLMCENGHIVAQVHAKQTTTIVGIKEVHDSIYDSKKVVVKHFIKPRRKLNVNRGVIRTNPEDDPDIQRHLEGGARLIRYESSEDI
jgi:hypothetical protein